MGSLIQSGSRLARLFSLLTLTISAIYAQTPPVSGTCAVVAVPSQVRAEGITERMGDIILQCSGSNPGAVLSGNLQVYLPVSITNRVDSSNLTRDAVLSVDYGSGFVPTGIPGLVTNQIIAFNGVAITVPPSGNLNIKISNIRANVNQGGTVAPRPLLAQLSFSSPASILVNQSLLAVANPQVGLYTTLYETGIRCTGSPLPSEVSLSNLFAAGTTYASTRFTEGFASSFQPAAAGEDNGTRLLVKYSGFPSNARILVPNALAGSNALVPTAGADLGQPQRVGQYVPGSRTLLLVRVLGTDSNGAGGFFAQVPAAGTSGASFLNGAAEVALTGGAGFVVYEVVDANPSLHETVQFPTFIGLPAVNAPAVAQVSASFAPISPAPMASTSAPVPRFAAIPAPSDCTLLGDCGAAYFPQLYVQAGPVQLTAVAGGAMTSNNGYIPIKNSGGGIMNWTATVNYTNGSGWLNLSETSGQNANSIIVVANARNLAAGTYRANIVIEAGLAGTTTIPVTLTVTAAPPPVPAPAPAPALPPTPSVVVTRVVNAATFDATPLVAGSLGTIMGSRLSGTIVRVTFDGAAARLLYTSDSQINLQVPEAVAAKDSATLVVTVDGVSSLPQTVALAPAWPSIFANGILNQDNSVNSSAEGARPGSILQIFATGIPAGAIVSARIAGRGDLIPLYAGEAPTVPGVQQVNVAIPEDLAASSADLVLCALTAGRQYCSAAAPLSIW
jgi:uncharacterized protein (TIGR03437 family)